VNYNTCQLFTHYTAKKRKKKKNKGKGKEADLRWKLGYNEEVRPVAQLASMEGMVVGVGCW
jgi:hypothetical protein